MSRRNFVLSMLLRVMRFGSICFRMVGGIRCHCAFLVSLANSISIPRNFVLWMLSRIFTTRTHLVPNVNRNWMSLFILHVGEQCLHSQQRCTVDAFGMQATPRHSYSDLHNYIHAFINTGNKGALLYNHYGPAASFFHHSNIQSRSAYQQQPTETFQTSILPNLHSIFI